MKPITAQVSLYPLRRPHLAAEIERTVDLLRRRGLKVEPGSMSTLVAGAPGELFAALQEAFEVAAESGQLVMVVTLSNACPDGTA